MKVVLAWTPIALLLAIFPALYAASANVPGNNTFGIDESVLKTFHELGGVFMYGINAVITPKLVSFIVDKFHGGTSDLSTYHATRVIMFTRMLLMLIVPACVTIVTSQDCYRGWLKVWGTCQSETNFNTQTTLISTALADPSPIIWLTSEKHAGVHTSTSVDLKATITIPLTSHEDICAMATKPGRCSRQVVDSLGHLVVSKLFFAAFISPFLAHAAQSQVALHLKKGFLNLASGKGWASPRITTVDVSVEIAGIVMLLEYCVVLGFVVPVILPLTALTIVAHLAVFHYATQLGHKLEMDAKPSTIHLRGSAVLGYALITWFFIENDLYGQELVAVGMPVLALAAMGLERAFPVTQSPWACKWLLFPSETSAKLESHSITVVLAPASSLAGEAPAQDAGPPSEGATAAAPGGAVLRV